MAESFSFEHTFEFAEDFYVELNMAMSKKARPIRLLLVVICSLGCLFWSYTLLLGVAGLLLVGMDIFLPSRIPATVANLFRKTSYLHQRITYGADEKRLWVKSPLLNADFDWKAVSTWSEQEGWLRITATHVPSVWFPIATLKEADVYDYVTELCKRHGVRFDSPPVKKSCLTSGCSQSPPCGSG